MKIIVNNLIHVFCRSLFVLLDSLKEETSPVKTIVSTWLTHVIQRGDLNRVLTPILSMMLHPDTARLVSGFGCFQQFFFNCFFPLILFFSY